MRATTICSSPIPSPSVSRVIDFPPYQQPCLGFAASAGLKLCTQRFAPFSCDTIRAVHGGEGAAVSPWDEKPHEILPGRKRAYLDEQDVVTFLEPPKELIPLEPASYNPAAYLWKKIEDIPEERRHRLLQLLKPRLISRAWQIAGTRYKDPKLAKKSASNLLSCEDGEISFEFYNCRTSGGPFPISWINFFRKVIFSYKNGKVFGRFIGRSMVAQFANSVSPLYFVIRQVTEVMPTEQPCDLAYEFGDGLLDIDEYPQGFPRPVKHLYPFNDQVVIYIRHIGPGVSVGQAWQEGKELQQVPQKLCAGAGAKSKSTQNRVAGKHYITRNHKTEKLSLSVSKMQLQTQSLITHFLPPLRLPQLVGRPQFSPLKHDTSHQLSLKCSLSAVSEPTHLEFSSHKPFPAEVSRTIMELSSVGTLSTLTHDGWPLGIGVRFAVDPDGTPILRLNSQFSGETRSSLHVQLEQSGLRTPQCTIQGSLHKPQDQIVSKLHTAWKKKFGEEVSKDSIYIVNVDRVLQMGDFKEDGMLVTSSEYRNANPDPLRDFADKIVSEINANNIEDIHRFCNVYVDLDFQISEAKMIWVDRLGFDVRVYSPPTGVFDVRIPFPREVLDEKGAKSSFNGMSQLAWEVEKNYYIPDFVKVKQLKQVS